MIWQLEASSCLFPTFRPNPMTNSNNNSNEQRRVANEPTKASPPLKLVDHPIWSLVLFCSAFSFSAETFVPDDRHFYSWAGHDLSPRGSFATRLALALRRRQRRRRRRGGQAWDMSGREPGIVSLIRRRCWGLICRVWAIRM